MLVKKILTFIEEIKSCINLGEDDVELLKSLVERFDGRNEELQLSADDLKFVANCCEQRGHRVLDNQLDYTLNPDGVNAKWIDFAKEFAPLANKNYLKLLFPSIKNTVDENNNALDYNSNTLLIETVRPENFYLGGNGETLFRKRGLCEHLILHHFKLSTRRQINGPISALTVRELTRLKSCLKPCEFFIGNERFVSFWDFLEKKAFVQLQVAGDLQEKLMSGLVKVVASYFSLKGDKAEFKTFKEIYKQFTTQMTEYRLEDINFFYGMRIAHKDTSLYLLDFLIAMDKATSYTIDDFMNSLTQYLLQLHPTMMQNKRPCLNLLLSLFTRKFDTTTGTGEAISLWDIEKTVSSEAARIYSSLSRVVSSNRYDKMQETYPTIIDKIVKPAIADVTLLGRSRQDSSQKWYLHIEKGTLPQIGIQFFDPELILASLLSFKTNQSVNNYQVTCFLDELIRSYATSENEILVATRINILFFELIGKMSPDNKQVLMLTMLLQDPQQAKTCFTKHCILYINGRLNEIGLCQRGFSFYPEPNGSGDNANRFLEHVESENVDRIVNLFKSKLDAIDQVVSVEAKKKMMTYLTSLSRPILSVEERRQVASMVKTQEYLGSPT